MTFDFLKPGGGAAAPAGGAGADAGLSPATPITVTAQNLDQLIMDSRGKLIVLYARGGKDPATSAVAETFEKVLRPEVPIAYAMLDVDNNRLIAQQIGLSQTPAVLLLAQGQVLAALRGDEPRATIEDVVVKLFGPNALDPNAGEETADLGELLELGESALAAGDLAQAAQIYGAALSREPQNVEAMAGLARCHITAGNLPQAEATLAMVPSDVKNVPAVDSARAALELAKKSAEAAGALESLRQKVAADPADAESRFQFALALNATGDRGAALDELMTILRRDRDWNDGAARQQLIEFFEAWGPKDPHTVAGRRKLSSLLFA